MMNFTKFLLIGTFLAGASASAFASPLNTGSIDIDGTFKIVGSGKTSGIDFTNNPTSTTNGSGVLGTLNATNDVTFSSTFTFSNVKPGTGELLFAITKGSSTVDFYVTGYSYSSTSLTFTGYLIDNLGASAPATFVEQVTNTGGSNYSYTGDLVVTPEPDSIVLLGTGLLSMCGMITTRRRRKVDPSV